MVVAAWPKCRKCAEGELVPLSDYGTEGASVTYKGGTSNSLRPNSFKNRNMHIGNTNASNKNKTFVVLFFIPFLTRKSFFQRAC